MPATAAVVIPVVVTESKRMNLNGGVRRLRSRYIGIAVAAALVMSLFLAPVRQAAARFLGLLRASEITSVGITMDDVQNIQRALLSQDGRVDIERYGSFEVTQGEPLQITAESEIPESLGQPQGLPVGMRFQGAWSEQSSDITMRLHVDAINELSRSMGGTSKFPQELDGQPFVAHFGPRYSLSYSDGGDSGISLSVFVQPELDLPDGADPIEIRRAVLDLPFLPANLKTQLERIDNWQETLPIPFRQDQMTSTPVTINGRNGVLIDSIQSHYGFVIVAWPGDGVIYMLEGTGLTTTEMTNIASSVR
jgi:hypothetical protein